MDWQLGDIILLKRQKRSGLKAIWIVVKQIFLFFIAKVGLIEAVAKWYHIEMFYGNLGRGDLSITMEPPKCKLVPLPKISMRVYRLKNKPSNFNNLFTAYCNKKLGEKYDFCKWWAMMFDRIFGTRWFTKHFVNPYQDVCGEFVSRYYQEINNPCTTENPESAIPSDVNSYCENNPQLFEMVLDKA